MDLSTFRIVLAPAGQSALADALALAPTEHGFLALFEKLRKRHPPELAKAALETVLLRERARTKFPRAERMYFTREALEQASGDAAAGHRAQRFARFGVVADLCCGIGGDTLALAFRGLTVRAIESDPLRLAMAEANARALGVSERVSFQLGDALAMPLPDVRSAFVDPNRRAGTRRHLDPENYSPPLSAIRRRFAADFPLAVKIAPGVSWDDVGERGAEVEFVSVSGELKECVLWFGAFRTAARRATILPAGATMEADHVPAHLPSVEPGRYLFDPDPAVVRAGLADRLAADFGMSPIDQTVKLYTAESPVESVFATMYRVDLAARVHAGKLRVHLRKLGVGRVTIVKRGSSIDADDLVKKLKLTGEEHRVIVLTRAAGAEVMIVGERAATSSP